MNSLSDRIKVKMECSLPCQTDGAASHSSAGSTMGLGLKVVCCSMNDHAAGDDGLITVQRQQRIHDIKGCHTVFISDDIAQIAHMPLLSIRRTVGLGMGIEMPACRGSVVGSTITEFMDM